MGRFVRGDVVVLPFPFSDLSATRRRPALVIAELDGDDVLLCQITTRGHRDRWAIRLEPGELASGHLQASSNIRPSRLFTADGAIIAYRLGAIAPAKLSEVTRRLLSLVSGEAPGP